MSFIHIDIFREMLLGKSFMTCTNMFGENLILLWSSNRFMEEPFINIHLKLKVFVASFGKGKLEGPLCKFRV